MTAPTERHMAEQQQSFTPGTAKRDWIDKALCAAYRIAPEPFAERISLAISARRVERNWREQVSKHLAQGGVVGSYRSSAGTQEFLL